MEARLTVMSALRALAIRGRMTALKKAGLAATA
jgi:hypothetical protein